MKNLLLKHEILPKKLDGVTRFKLHGGKDFDKWVHQNQAKYAGEYVEGCLLDNFVMVTKRGFAAFYEIYVNANSSAYYVEFQPGPAQKVFSTWYEFEDKAEAAEA